MIDEDRQREKDRERERYREREVQRDREREREGVPGCHVRCLWLCFMSLHLSHAESRIQDTLQMLLCYLFTEC